MGLINCRFLDKTTFTPYFLSMKCTITSKGQITIPVRIREKLRLKPGDILDFDENATLLVARKAIPVSEWKQGISGLQEEWKRAQPDSSWSRMSSKEILDDLRGAAEPESKAE